MSENITPNDLESEIAELSRQIENKKRELETENGIVHEGVSESSEKEVVSEVVAEHFYEDAHSSSDTVAVRPTAVNKDYLDTLLPEAVEAINTYVSMIPKDGIRKTVSKVQSEQPFIIDAFHDALVTRLYDELKSRGIIK